jgi:hypothetical protein
MNGSKNIDPFTIRYHTRWKRDAEGNIHTWLLGGFYRDYSLNKAGQFGRFYDGEWHWTQS